MSSRNFSVRILHSSIFLSGWVPFCSIEIRDLYLNPTEITKESIDILLIMLKLANVLGSNFIYTYIYISPGQLNPRNPSNFHVYDVPHLKIK